MIPRELIYTGTDKRYVRRDQPGQFRESENVGRSSAQDQKRIRRLGRSAVTVIAATGREQLAPLCAGSSKEPERHLRAGVCSHCRVGRSALRSG